MDVRHTKAAQIARGHGVRREDHLWLVRSQSHSGTHVVRTKGPRPTCTCPDFETTGEPCKHILAVDIIEGRLSVPSDVVDIQEPKKKTYQQNWPAYNAAQTHEKENFADLLKALCQGIKPPNQPRRGRPRLPLPDVVFSAVMKVYGTMSGRRSMSEIRSCKKNGHVDAAPHYNTISRYLEDPKLTPLLRTLLTESATPLADIERTFAVDSTGFGTTMYDRWFDEKWGKTQRRAKWLKVHAICGTLTHVVTAVEITERGDATQFAGLVETTASHFKIDEVSADKAYSSKRNLELVEKLGATPYIPFKENTSGEGPETWRRLYHLYQFNRPEFLEHYHRRSNIETVFWMVKEKFGSFVRSKTETAQINELLCKFIAHNIYCLIMSMYELGIDPKFRQHLREAS